MSTAAPGTEPREWPLGPVPISSYDRLQTMVDRRLREHIELMAMTKRLSFLLHSTGRLVDDQSFRALTEGAVRDAEQLLAKVAR